MDEGAFEKLQRDFLGGHYGFSSVVRERFGGERCGRGLDVFLRAFPENANVAAFKLCATCEDSLLRDAVPLLCAIDEYVTPPCFMQLRWSSTFAEGNHLERSCLDFLWRRSAKRFLQSWPVLRTIKEPGWRTKSQNFLYASLLRVMFTMSEREPRFDAIYISKVD